MEEIKPTPITVTELNNRLKNFIENEITFQQVLLKGEISSLTKATSGHWYLTLKDKTSVIKCNIWKSNAVKIKFPIKIGDEIVLVGYVQVYPPRGEYSFIAQEIFSNSMGTLQLQFEKLKAELLKEGLFSNENKIPLPMFPKKIALVTSPTGAVIRDMYDQRNKRMPNVDLLLIPALVQGENAARSLTGALRVADNLPDVDLVILARGGGSMEDLWCFNEEILVRQVATMKKPIITGVGHETDTTLVDYASDMRASTPTQAMEIALRNRNDILNYIKKAEVEIYNIVWNNFNSMKKLFETLSNNPYLKEPERIINDRKMTVDNLTEEMIGLCKDFLKDKKHYFGTLVTKLDMLSPLKILAQGYSLTEKDGKVLHNVEEVSSGDEITTYLQNGTVKSVVK